MTHRELSLISSTTTWVTWSCSWSRLQSWLVHMKTLFITCIIYLVSQLITGYYFFELSNAIWTTFPDGKLLYFSQYLNDITNNFGHFSLYYKYVIFDFIHPIIYTFSLYQVYKYLKHKSPFKLNKVFVFLPAIFDYLENISIYLLINNVWFMEFLLFVTPVFSFLKWGFVFYLIFHIIIHVYFEDK